MTTQLQHADREHHAGLAALLIRVQDASAAHTRAMGRIRQGLAALAAQVGPMSELTEQRDAAQAAACEFRGRWEGAAALCDSLRADQVARDAAHEAVLEELRGELQMAQDAVADVQRQRDSAQARLLDMQDYVQAAAVQVQQMQCLLEENEKARDVQRQELAACCARCTCVFGAAMTTAL